MTGDPQADSIEKIAAEIEAAAVSAVWPKKRGNTDIFVGSITGRDQLHEWHHRLEALDRASKAAIAAQTPGPMPPEEYRCEGCGAEFSGDPGRSHGRSEDDGHGREIEVECGPVSCVRGPMPPEERAFLEAAKEYMAADAIGTEPPPDLQRVTRAAIALLKAYRAVYQEAPEER